MRLLILLLVAGALAAPAAAGAATVSVGPVTGLGDDRAQEVRYVAAPGEVNALTVTAAATVGSPPEATLTDPGATIAAGTGCTAAPDGHSATCAFAGYVAIDRSSVRAELGDADDTLREDPETGPVADPFAVRPVTLPLVGLGGPGEDTLTGGIRDDRLDGGGGTDVLRGGSGADVLADGDTDANADADVLDGGGGSDTVSYAGRTQDVTIDLDGSSPFGADGEGDVVHSVESAEGGAGDDVIRAAAGFVHNRLIGGAGDDRIRGAGYDDTIEGGPGDDVLEGRGSELGEEFPDVLDGGPGRDRLLGGTGRTAFAGGGGLDRYRCRGRLDTVTRPQEREVVPRTCARVIFGGVSAQAHGRLRGPRRVSQRVRCSQALTAPALRGTLALRERGGAHRRVGRGRFTCEGEGLPAATTIRLTRLGARLARRKGGVLVTTEVRAKGLSEGAWSARLR